MEFQTVEFKPEHLEAVKRLCRKAYPERPVSDSFYLWRYIECPDQVGFLNMDGNNNCTAMIWAFKHRYRFHGQLIYCLETCDWYSLPEHRSTLGGLKVLMKIKSSPEPAVGIGGSAETKSVFPRLGWTNMGESIAYHLPLGGKVATDSLRRILGWQNVSMKWLEQFLCGMSSIWNDPKLRCEPPLGEFSLDPVSDESIRELYLTDSTYHATPIFNFDMLRWARTRTGTVGDFLPVYFFVAGKLQGWSLSRIYNSNGIRRAMICELFAPNCDSNFYTWIVSATLLKLKGFLPDVVSTAASCIRQQAALKRNGFWASKRHPVNICLKGTAPATVHHFGKNTSDHFLLPYGFEI